MWFAFALLSAGFSGLQMFFTKVAAERRYDPYHVSAVAAVVTAICALLAFIVSADSLSTITPLLLWLGVASAALYVARTVTQLESLRFIDAAIFFPLYKVIGPALVTILGVFFLKDHLSGFELLGIALSCIVPLLLITRAEHARQKNLAFGVALMFVSTALAAVTAAVNALGVASDSSLAIPFMLTAYGGAVLVAGALYVRQHRKTGIVQTLKGHSTRSALSVGAAIGLMQFISFYFLLVAFAGGGISLAYSVNAHYILIPVILSVWIYKEHWNKQKAFALVVSILALVLLHP
jgi:drug/metabolite transporter (DMT)-like permease